jgi:hypothetical protein
LAAPRRLRAVKVRPSMIVSATQQHDLPGVRGFLTGALVDDDGHYGARLNW